MSEYKRNISEVSSSFEPPDKKAHSKPGRKPVDTEPKSKRTAQNRAAQRAYRERKEKKMKDLEDKVKSLEDENIKVMSEADFLKAQVDMLKSELAQYRGVELPMASSNSMPASSIQLPQPTTSSFAPDVDRAPKSSVSSSSRSDRLSLSGLPQASPDIVDIPWAKDNAASVVPPAPLDLFRSPDSETSVSTSGPRTVPSSDFVTKFDEQVDPFCESLNEACGSIDQPVPKAKRTVPDYHSPFSALVTPSANSDLTSDPFFQVPSDDPLSFMNDVNFDMNLAFKQPEPLIPEEDPVLDDTLGLLTTQESVYDPLASLTQETTPNSQASASTPATKEVNTNFNFNDFIKSSIEPDVVPASPRGMKCNEIWERITSHPKYTEIDIDGLCSELKSKAKCSESGVVINQADVNYFIEQSALSAKR
ncbi:AP-1-like transcription factor Cap1p [Diutina catenulata]